MIFDERVLLVLRPIVRWPLQLLLWADGVSTTSTASLASGSRPRMIPTSSCDAVGTAAASRAILPGGSTRRFIACYRR